MIPENPYFRYILISDALADTDPSQVKDVTKLSSPEVEHPTVDQLTINFFSIKDEKTADIQGYAQSIDAPAAIILVPIKDSDVKPVVESIEKLGA